MSRNLKSLRFESLRAALGKLPVRNAIIDGEIICLDEKGVSQFNWLLSGRCARLLFAQHVEGGGKELFNEICRCDLEGIVAKRTMGMYREDRPDWIKVKNRTYSQAEGRHELLTRGRRG